MQHAGRGTFCEFVFSVTDLKNPEFLCRGAYLSHREEYLHFCIKMNLEHFNVPIVSGLFKMLKRWWSAIVPGPASTNSNNGRKRSFMEIFSPGRPVDGPPSKRAKMEMKKQEDVTPNPKNVCIDFGGYPKRKNLSFDFALTAAKEETETSGDPKPSVQNGAAMDVKTKNEVYEGVVKEPKPYNDEREENGRGTGEMLKHKETKPLYKLLGSDISPSQVKIDGDQTHRSQSNVTPTPEIKPMVGEQTRTDGKDIDSCIQEIIEAIAKASNNHGQGSSHTNNAEIIGTDAVSPDCTSNDTSVLDDGDMSDAAEMTDLGMVTCADETLADSTLDTIYGTPAQTRVCFNDNTIVHELSVYSDVASEFERSSLIEDKDSSKNENIISTAVLSRMEKAKDILRCRLINKTWKCSADEILTNRRSIVLTFSATAEEEESRSIFPLEKLFELCELFGGNAKEFLCKSFEIRGVNLEELCVQKFLYNFGVSIVRLKLGIKEGTSCAAWDLLRKSLPNLEELIFTSFPRTWRYCSSRCGHQWQGGSPCLKLNIVGIPNDGDGFTYCGEGASTIVEDLVRACPSFRETIRWDRAVVVEESRGPVEDVESLTVEFTRQDAAQVQFDLQKYAKLSCRTKELETRPNKLHHFQQYWKGAGRILSRILESSAESLVTWNTSPLGFINNLKFPAMKNLRTLNFYLDSQNEDGFYSVFPVSVDIESSFPQLQTVGILFGSCGMHKSFPEALYQPSGFSTVTTLQCNVVLATDCDWSTLPDIFPNIQQLSVTIRLGQLAAFLPWFFKQNQMLETTKLYIEEDSYRYCYPFMDEIITGIPEHHCQWLRNRNCSVTAQLAQTFRTEPSVLNLKGLRQVDFIFESKTAYEEHIRINPFITPVASVYGLGLIPGLKGNYYCRKK